MLGIRFKTTYNSNENEIVNFVISRISLDSGYSTDNAEIVRESTEELANLIRTIIKHKRVCNIYVEFSLFKTKLSYIYVKLDIFGIYSNLLINILEFGYSARPVKFSSKESTLGKEFTLLESGMTEIAQKYIEHKVRNSVYSKNPNFKIPDSRTCKGFFVKRDRIKSVVIGNTLLILSLDENSTRVNAVMLCSNKAFAVVKISDSIQSFPLSKATELTLDYIAKTYQCTIDLDNPDDMIVTINKQNLLNIF